MATWLSSRLLLLSFMALLIFSAGCGKKAPPFLPEQKIPAKVDQLSGQYEDGRIRLSGQISGDDKGVKATGCRIYHAWYPADDPPCEGCPIEMIPFTEPGETQIADHRFACDIPSGNREGIWYLQVFLVDDKGAEGPPSERIRLEIRK